MLYTLTYMYTDTHDTLVYILHAILIYVIHIYTIRLGFMKITGRIKELIITAGGENVPPVLIEDQMKVRIMTLSLCILMMCYRYISVHLIHIYGYT